MLFELALIFALVLLNGLFAGAEIAIVGMDRARLRQLVEEGNASAKAVKSLRSSPERFFATVQIVITVVSAGAGALGGATFAQRLAPFLEPLIGDSSREVSIVLVVAVISYLSLVLGELVPKSLAMKKSERYALLVAPALLRLSSAARPLVWLLTQSSNALLRLFGDRATFTESRLSPDQLRELVDEAAELGTLDAQVGEIASRAFDFAALTAAHVMVPRTRLIAIPSNATHDQIRATVLESAHSRLPVYEGTLDNVIGYIFYKDLLALAWEGELLVLKDLLRPPFFVIEGMPASELLKQMRERRTHLAFIVDESGGLSGIVTLDDLIEELVGEVFGEIHHEVPNTTYRDQDGSIVALAEVTIRDLNREYDLNLPESDEWSTLGGLCVHLAGRVPRPGDRYRATSELEIVVEAASDRAATQIRIVPSLASD
ncbi:MAG TPA: hemolysin family protein, partial [Polyangiaceae bacterium]